MSELGSSHSTLVDSLAAHGHAIADGLISFELCREALKHFKELEAKLSPAGVGKGALWRRDVAVRTDAIRWLDDSDPLSLEGRLHAAFVALGDDLGRELRVPFQSFEGHYAMYEPGGRYVKHVDAFRDDDTRYLSVVLYLNETWDDGDGGELRLYEEGDHEAVALEVKPSFGRLALFLARHVAHEVLPAKRARRSIAGWFSVRRAGS